MNKQKILQELKEGFAKAKEELGFKATYEELEKYFYLEDGVLKDGFVSPKYEAQLRHRILDAYASWVGSLHNYILPNPQDLVSLSEIKKLTDADKREASDLIGVAMKLLRENSIAALSKDIPLKSKIIDDSLRVWKERFSPGILELTKKAKVTWDNDGVPPTPIH